MNKIRIFQWVRAYAGIEVMVWWGIWCINEGYGTYADLTSFVTSIGGILH